MKKIWMMGLALALGTVGCANQSSIVRAMNECQTSGTGSENVSLGGEIASMTANSKPLRFVASVDLGAETPPNPILVNVEDDNNLTIYSHVQPKAQIGMLGALHCSASVGLFVPTQMTLDGKTLPEPSPKPSPTTAPTTSPQ